MKFILRDYLLTLRERGELDRALGDLLMGMNFRLLKTPSRGEAERGLDIAAVGRSSSRLTLYLIQVKMGRVNRRAWDTGPNSVRQSLNDVLDNLTELRRLAPSARPIVVLAHNGTMDGSVQDRFRGYVEEERRRRRVAIELWDVSKLVELFNRHLLNEQLFDPKIATLLRRTLAFSESSGYDLRHLQDLLSKIIPAGRVSDRAAHRIAVQIRLALAIVEHYARTDYDDLALAVKAYETGLLHIVSWFWREGLLDKKKYRSTLSSIIDRYLGTSLDLFNRLDSLLDVPHGLAVGGTHAPVEYPIRSIQIAGLAAQWFLVLARYADQPGVLDLLGTLARFLGRLGAKAPIISRPLFDDQMLEVGLYTLATFASGNVSAAKAYVRDVVGRLILAGRLGGALPEGTGNVEAVATLLLAGERPPDYVDESSTLLPMLAELTLLLDLPETYVSLRERWNTAVDFQEWYLDETFPSWGFVPHEGADASLIETGIRLPEDFAAWRQEVSERDAFDEPYRSFLKSKRFFDLMFFVAARTHRHRLTPAVWREFLPAFENLGPS